MHWAITLPATNIQIEFHQNQIYGLFCAGIHGAVFLLHIQTESSPHQCSGSPSAYGLSHYDSAQTFLRVYFNF